MRTKLLILLFLASLTSYAQYTLIPDVNFENKLIELGIDSGVADGKVLTNNINKLTSLDVSSSSIRDLTGIQDFVSLTSLIFFCNQLTALDVSKNLALITLDCSFNKLTSLDVSKNTLLSTLYCNINQLTSLDVSKNLALTSLICSQNLLTTLDVTKNETLKELSCNSNELTALNVTKNADLTFFYCSSNKLVSLNLKNGNNTLLTELSFSSNPNLICIAVDDVAYSNANWAYEKDYNAFYSPFDCSTITALPDANFEDKLINLGFDTDGKNGIVLKTSIEDITTLDVSNSSITDLTGIQSFTALTTLNCSGNLINKLDVSKNTAFSTLNCANNPTLICIQVADVMSTTNWTITKDPIAVFNLDCTVYTLIPDSKFEDKLIFLGIDTDGKNGKVATARIESLPSLDVSSSSITNLTGIQDFKSLTYLECGSNQLTSLDVSKNKNLTALYFDSNKLTSIDLSHNTLLKTLNCSSNSLTALDVSKSLALTDLYCGTNQLTSLNLSNNTLLSVLDCDSNSLINLAVNKNTDLTQLYCSNNQLTSLDLSYNTLLLFLDCDSNQLTSLDISKNLDLFSLTCGSNQLTALDVSKNEALTQLYCYDNKIINLNLFRNSELKDLMCGSNELTAIDITNNLNLEVFDCQFNKITNLDISKNSLIVSFGCDNNQLTYLNLKNGANTILDLTYVDFVNNPNLKCIQVDDVNYSNTNWENAKDATANYSTDCQTTGLYTLIPDVNFENKLIALGIESGVSDGRILTSKIDTLTSLDVAYSSITDLTGIQGFVALTSLKCNGNYELKSLDVSKNTALTLLDCNNNYLVTSIDVSKNTSLTSLNCYSNKLNSLDVTKNTKLTELQCSSNKLTSLDVAQNTALTKLNCAYNSITSLNISLNTALTSLTCTSNQLTNLDVSKNIKLVELSCGNNQYSNLNVSKNIALTSLICNSNLLTTLDVSKNIALTRLLFYKNQITTIDVTKNTALEIMDCSSNQLANLDVSKNLKMDYLYCDINQLTALDVTKNADLGLLDCSNNRLTNLDVSLNTNLHQLECATNQLYSLNLKNGNNTLFDLFTSPDPNFIIYNVDFRNNPNLSCIQVDDANYSNTKWSTQKDATANFNTDCNQYTLITDSNFEEVLIGLGIDTDGKNGKVATTNLTNIKILDISNSGITNLSGIESFPDLEKLICKGNSISTINLSSNTALVYLDCSNNPLTTLNVSNNKLLVELYCDGAVAVTNKSTTTSSQLTTLDLSNNTLLTKLSCSYNQLVSLDLSKNNQLTTVNCSNNNLTYLNLNNNNNTLLTSLNFKNNFKLSCIKVDNPTFSINNWVTAKDATATYSSTCSALGIEESVFDKINIYPNPTKGELHISNITLEKVTVYDTLGKLVKTITSSSGSTEHSIDLKGLPKGTYFLYLENDGDHTAKKIIVE
jgi:Leucine-rich repeat (LRR) protein